MILELIRPQSHCYLAHPPPHPLVESYFYLIRRRRHPLLVPLLPPRAAITTGRGLSHFSGGDAFGTTNNIGDSSNWMDSLCP